MPAPVFSAKLTLACCPPLQVASQSHAHSHGAACACAPWAYSGSIGHRTWNRAQCSASAPSPSVSWHVGTCSHSALTWALVDLSWKSSTRLCDQRLGHCRGRCSQTLRTYSWEVAAIRYSRPCQLRTSWAWGLAARSETSVTRIFHRLICDRAGTWPNSCIKKQYESCALWVCHDLAIPNWCGRILKVRSHFTI